MYRTVPYQIALFLLMVKTNVGYSVVATFMLENEECKAIAEALRLIKEAVEIRGYDWVGKYFMADKSWAEYNGIKTVFPGKHFIVLKY
jgi:putative methionine-R-sulfoxide reductase with GAF domain